MAVFQIVTPHTLILASIRIVEGTVTVSQAEFPIADVAVTQKLVVTVGALEPDVRSEATLVVFIPVTGVLLI